MKKRPFPSENYIGQVSFLAELRTLVLLGVHDVDQIVGDLVLFRDTEKRRLPAGIGERDVHTYPGDVSARDDKGICFGMISGADNRTCISSDSKHVAYFVFGVDGQVDEQIKSTLDLLMQYVNALALTAKTNQTII
ncbi:MAG: hypothetical protein PHT78_02765 [Desulfitobacteriaceae bacterium]|nr:hypothetical protein [Desulfitobacteriaceae bacterium]MDD4752161.1 hypothetical protein [Desulfitobacteriaceae bacterium]